MKRTHLMSAAAALLIGLATTAALRAAEEKKEEGKPAAKATDGVWLTSFKEAADASKATGRVVLVDFTGSDWCGYCIKLHDEVYTTDEFKALAKKNFLLLELDFPNAKKQSDEVKKQNAALAEKYKIEGFPTVLFLTPDGKEIPDTRIVGYPGKAPWMKKVVAVAEAHPATQPSSKE